MIIKFKLIIIFCAIAFSARAQNIEQLSWSHVATNMPEDWYGSQESKNVAENVLLYQREAGGWPKNIQKQKVLSDKQKKALTDDKVNPPAIFDNGATTTEMRFLAKMYAKVKDERYRTAFDKGLEFILNAQYPNGGWPMFFPLRKGYYTHITYNDNGMINIMNTLRSIIEKEADYDSIVTPDIRTRAKTAFDKGVECILKTQYVQNGKLTVWCAQHDEVTLQPAPARAYELPSLSGSESVGIVLLLMKIENPSPEIIKSVCSAMDWFEKTKIVGYKVVTITNEGGINDRVVVADSSAPPMWARFYTLEDNRPYFASRDGIKRYSLSEISYERRNGYGWYSTAAQELYKIFPEWKKKYVKELR